MDAHPQIGEWRDGWYVVPYDVIFRDLDAFGHVNNAVFVTYFEWARAQWWFTLSGNRNARDIGFIVARVECDYKAQIRLERIEICTRVSEVGRTSFKQVYEIRRAGGEIAATGSVVCVMYDWKERTKVPVSDELRRAIEESQTLR